MTQRLGGKKVAGIKEVAELSGLSIATVSRALGGKGSVSAKSRKLAQDAAAELGFVLSYAASSLASGRNHNIGIVVPSVNRWFYSSVIDGASAVLLEAGYDLTLYTASQNESHRATILTDFLLRKRLDAVIAVSLELTESEVSQLLAIHRPVLGIGGPLPGADSLRVNDFDLAKRATEHLIGLGHKRIAHIGGDHEYDSDFKLPGTRRSGYQMAMEQAQLPTSAAWQRSSDFTVLGAYTTARSLLGDGLMRPTAVFAASDEMAIGTILAARDFGLRVPEELSVIGIDGHELGEVFGLTTFDQKPRAQGALAAGRILARLEQSSQDAAVAYQPVAEEFPTQFVVRSSTAVPPAE